MARAVQGSRETPIAEIVAELEALGIEAGDALLVHTASRAVYPVERGPGGLIDSLGCATGPGGTPVMPSWTEDNDRPFDPVTTPASRTLGIVAETFRQLSNVERSDHLFAFAARRPKAAQIISDPCAIPPHQHRGPVAKELDSDGGIPLLGVDHDSNTSLHLAESLAHVPYRRAQHTTVLRNGEAMRIDYLENDHCCQLSRRVNEWRDRCALQSRGTVGLASAKLVRSRGLIDIALAEPDCDPFVFLHSRDSEWEECVDAWQSVST